MKFKITKTKSKKYPKIVEEIHNEFFTASDDLLKKAEELVIEAKSIPIDKINRLKTLGFSQADEVAKSNDALKIIEISKEQKELIMGYKVKHPLYKFITEEQVKEICTKYNLVCGRIGLYKGFVPEKNLKDIEGFKGKNKNKSEMTLRLTPHNGGAERIVSVKGVKAKESKDYISLYIDGIHSFQQNKSEYDGVHFYGSATIDGVYFSGMVEVVDTQICAPVKDMDTTGMTIEGGYKVKNIHIPDPVVLQPIKGGYLIITAWGDEASDPMVVNELNN